MEANISYPALGHELSLGKNDDWLVLNQRGYVGSDQRRENLRLRDHPRQAAEYIAHMDSRKDWMVLFPSIDCVDFEYSLRAREAGYRIASSKDAILFYLAGETTTLQLFGIILLRTSNHSVERRCYMIRNRVAMTRGHFEHFRFGLSKALC
jgi:hypothetical protein